MSLTDSFCKDLVSECIDIEEKAGAKKKQKEENDITEEIQVYKLGSPYWRGIIQKAKEKGLINYKEEGILSSATKMDAPNPKYPSPAQTKSIMRIRKRLGEEGIEI